MANRNRATETLTADLAALEDLPRRELQQRWRDLYESPCPVRISRVLLIRALAYRMQEQVFGGVDRTTLRRLERASADLAAGRKPKSTLPPKSSRATAEREGQGLSRYCTTPLSRMTTSWTMPCHSRRRRVDPDTYRS